MSTHEEGEKCAADPGAMKRVLAAIGAIDDAVDREGGQALAGFYSFGLPCAQHSDAMCGVNFDALAEGLHPEAVATLRTQLTTFIERLDKLYPKG